MTRYTLLEPGGTPNHLDSFTGPLTNGTQFTVSTTVTLTGIWHYSFTGAQTLPTEVALYTTTGTLIFSDTSPSWSGVAGSGWVKYTASRSLSAGSYVAAAGNNAGGTTWYAITNAGWGPVTNGPLSCASDPNTFDTSGSFAFPATGYGANNIYLDVEVDDGSPSFTGTGTAAISLGVTETGIPEKTGTGTAAISLRASATGVPHKVGTGTAAISLTATTLTVSTKPSPGPMGWDLYSTLVLQSEYRRYYDSQPPIACPHDGVILKQGPGSDSNTLYCPMGNFYYPDDWDPDTMSGM